MAITNTTKVSSSETWATIPTTWASETRTWQETVSLMGNTARVTSSFSNTLLEGVTYLWATQSSPWQYLLPWQVTYGGITNTSKPA